MKLRDYQINIINKGIEILQKHGIVYYALEMRLGKTFISLFTANYFKPKKVLFITKKKAIDNIISDFKKTGFTYQLICTNYESLHKISSCNDIDIIILDESHRIGSFPIPNKATKILKKIAAGKIIIYLSGTPTPETEAQIFHQFWISDKSPFKEYNFFLWAKTYIDVYEETIKLKDKQTNQIITRKIKRYDKAKKDLIFEKIDKYFVRYSQQDAGFKQKVVEKFLYVKINELQKTIIEHLKLNGEYKSPNNWQIKTFSGASLQSKLHQIFSGTVIVDIEDKNDFKILSTDKANLIKNNFKNSKIVIFYKFQAEFEVLKSVFTNWTNKQFEFNQSKDKVFLGQITSCREGINLSTADYLIFYNISFSALDYWQTLNRFQSLDREKEAIVYWIFTENGIEEKIYNVVKTKKDYTLQFFKKDFILAKKVKQLSFF